MENSFQTSFIPKKPIMTAARPTRPPTSLFTILAFLVLVIVGLAAGGLFLYKNYLIKQKEVLSASLSRVRDSFEKDTIDELELYDKRTSASKLILANHIVFSPMFSLLGTLTLPSIQYTKFDQVTDTSGFSVKLSGVAEDYKSIALQADVFNSDKGRSFKNVVFSNLAKDKNSNVTFDLQFTVDPSLLSYEKDALLNPIQAVPQASTPTLTPTVNATDLPAASTTPSSGSVTLPPVNANGATTGADAPPAGATVVPNPTQ
jgi:hypothetical protein